MTLIPRAIRNLLARKAPATNCLAHLSEAPITYRSHRDEIADLLNEPHLEKLARMRRDMNGD